MRQEDRREGGKGRREEVGVKSAGEGERKEGGFDMRAEARGRERGNKNKK